MNQENIKTKKKIKTIKIDADKCNGCRSCEVICPAFHAKPRYSRNNPARSRICIIHEPLRDIYIPVYAGEYTASGCMGRDKYIIGGKEYDECAFCRAACPSPDIFREPDSGLPLKCDMCEGENEPLCIKWCIKDALTVEEREEECKEADEMGAGLSSLIDRYGLEEIMERIIKLTETYKE